MPASVFTDHTPESAPAASRPAMAAVTAKQGYLPTGVALLATSPELLNGFLKMSALFESTTLDQLSREVVIMTMATRNDCHLCVAMHTAKLTALDADGALIAALRGESPCRFPTNGWRRYAGSPSPRSSRAGPWTTAHSSRSWPTATPPATRWKWSWASAPTPCRPWPTG